MAILLVPDPLTLLIHLCPQALAPLLPRYSILIALKQASRSSTLVQDGVFDELIYFYLFIVHYLTQPKIPALNHKPAN